MSGYVFWDTNLLIYWVEDAAAWSGEVEELVAWQDRRGMKPVTSALSLGELLVHPFRRADLKLAQSYARLVEQLGCLPFGADEAWRFAELRARHRGLRPPDAIQLACASVFGVELFLTNDDRLSGLEVAGVGRVCGLTQWREACSGGL